VKPSKHIIQKQCIDIVLASGDNAFAFKDRVSEFCIEKLLPAMDRLFDMKVPKNKILHGDKLIIDVGEIPLDRWEEVLVDRVVEQLSKYIGDVTILSRRDEQYFLGDAETGTFIQSEKNIFREVSEQENLLRSIMFFIENGRLPWYSGIKTQSSLNDAFLQLTADRAFVKQLMQKIKNDPLCFERIVYQLKEHAILSLVIRTGFETAAVINLQKFLVEIVSKLKAASGMAMGSGSTKYLVYDLLLKSAIEYEEKDNGKSNWDDYFDILLHLIARKFEAGGLNRLIPILKESGFENYSERSLKVMNSILTMARGSQEQKQLLNSESSKNKIVLSNEKNNKVNTDLFDDGIFIGNAGIVLLHPFLSLLFENVGYIHNKEWISEDHQQRALVLTQFLVSGQEKYPEFDLMLNKILIGYPLESTLPAEIALSEFEKQEATDVLKSVVKHWTALKNTSIDGLQSAFLMREGKLTMNDNGFYLQVEHKTMDILMNRIPWSFSILKTPWMKQKLTVEWDS
jgi:hypothetical protein